jgi:hypothetical protein
MLYEHRITCCNAFEQKRASTIYGQMVMNSVISYAIQNLVQKGIGSFLSSGGSDKNSLQSALSHLTGRIKDTNHPLVQQVKSNSGTSDSNQAKQYTQQGIGVLNDHAGKDAQGLSSILGGIAGGGGGSSSSQGGMGDIANLAGGLLQGDKK